MLLKQPIADKDYAFSLFIIIIRTVFRNESLSSMRSILFLNNVF